MALTAALAAGCAAAPPPAIELAPAPAAPPTAIDIPPQPPAPASAAPAPAAPPQAAAPEECAEEDVGSLAICDQLKIGPTCENAYGAIAACKDLTRMYRPAVAEKIATCVVKSSATRKRCPKYSDDAECVKNAVKAVCVRPSLRDQCADMMAACTKRKQKIKYTLDRCAQLLSAANPSFVSNHTFTMAGLHTSDGTPWAEGCWLD